MFIVCQSLCFFKKGTPMNGVQPILFLMTLLAELE